MKLNDLRGSRYRSTYCTIVDDPEYRALSHQARLCLWTILYAPENNLAGIYVFSPGLISDRAGLTPGATRRAIHQLEQGRWVAIEGSVIWVRNQLRYDPSVPLAGRKGLAAVENVLKGLPRVGLVEKFCGYYEIPNPREGAPRPHRRGIGTVSPQEQEQEQEQEPIRSSRDDRRAWESTFDSHFWPPYPRKVAKEAARKAWAALRPTKRQDYRAKALAVLDLLEERIRGEWADRPREKIPHAATFLRGEAFPTSEPSSDPPPSCEEPTPPGRGSAVSNSRSATTDSDESPLLSSAARA